MPMSIFSVEQDDAAVIKCYLRTQGVIGLSDWSCSESRPMPLQVDSKCVCTRHVWLLTTGSFQGARCDSGPRKCRSIRMPMSNFRYISSSTS